MEDNVSSDNTKGWNSTTLGEVAEFINGDRGKNYPNPLDRVEHGVPFINTGHIEPTGWLSDERMDYITLEKFNKLGSGKVRNGDIVYCLRGSTIGKTARNKYSEGAIASSLIIIRAKKNISQDYLYYFLTSPFGQSLAKTNDNGSAQPNLSGRVLSQYPIKIPSYNQQCTIAGYLNSLDNKIQLNQQTNQTHEQMAQALFKSWFVDFDLVIDNALEAGNEIPDALQHRVEIRKKAHALQKQNPNIQPLPAATQRLFPSEFEHCGDNTLGIQGWIPKGWDVTSLGRKIIVKRGGSPRPIKDYIVDDGLPWTKISDATASNSRFINRIKESIKPEGLSKTTFLKKGTLILSNSATPGLPKFLDLDACVHDGWLHFPLKETFTDLYLYQLFLVVRKELVQQGNGSVFTNLKTDILKNHKVVVPHSATLSQFDKIMNDFHRKMHAISESISKLENLRDMLIPKLISGEISLNKDFTK